MNTLYYNANIYQMNEPSPQANPDSMIISKKKIIEIGPKESLEKKYNLKKKVNLEGKTVLPGLVDPHGHFLIEAIASSFFVPFFSPPLGSTNSIKEVIDTLKKHDGKNNPKVIVGYGFDDTKTLEYRMPDRHELDKISTKKPVILLHQSLHMISVNTFTLEKSGYIKNYPVPTGGVAYKDENGDFTGVIEETPAIMPIFEKIIYKLIKGNNILKIIQKGALHYLSNGFTTVHEGAAKQEQLNIFKLASFLGKMPAKLIFTATPKKDGKFPDYKSGQGVPLDRAGKITPGPVKLFTDGSIQAYTAFLKLPYFKQHRTRPKSEDYRGYLTIDTLNYSNTIKRLHEAKMQYAVHANGDDAISLIIETEKKYCKNKDLGNIIIHCQMVLKEQLQQMKELGMSASFFPSHIHVWGKQHRLVYLGEERAACLDPLKTAKDEKVLFSIHHDAPVTPPDPWLPVWASVARLDVDNNELGTKECISAYDAILALTRDAALQYHIKDRGTLEKGKFADFIVLNQDPITINPSNIRKTKVLQTFVNGKMVYSRKE